ncbi:protein NIM1-INTERACTING 2 [Argentina anserina]|uniref:protein NIM1-INTERACTING 2 n=1 Tax=Argentina anserina TaxID=57926 RepID=UPI0021767593|nr:protein NIM1-INTERACTING 2 [Potentilla anserina]
MDAEKRKRDDGVDRKRAKPAEDKGTVVTEEEVEEFFTILRRIHVAARQFGKREGEPGRKLTTSKKMRLSFEARDFEEEEKKPKADSGLDLNSDPASEES